MTLKSNLEKIMLAILAAEKKANRPAGSVKLIAVSKTVDENSIIEMHRAGQNIFAEGRPQMLRDKAKKLNEENLCWHFIGPLQSNKIKYVYPIADLVHSIDSEDLLEHFIGWYEKTGKKCPCLLEVHISNEENKRGFDADAILGIIDKYRNHEALDIRGLMGMAPFVAEEDIVRACFANLSRIFEKSKELEGAAYQAIELSMGMTSDFNIAIEEGATMVRIGTALFSGA